MKTGINLFLQIYGELGIPIHSRELTREIIALNKETNIIPIAQRNISENNELKAFIRKPNSNYPAFLFWYPFLYDELLGIYPQNIGYYIFEYTKIPKQFVEAINRLDLICTASEWGKNILKENGVNIPIEIIRGGVNSNKFNLSVRDIWNGHSTFKFLHIGKCEARKSTEELVIAFYEGFKDNKDVSLTLAIDNPHIKNFEPKNFVKSILGFVPANIKTQPLVHNVLTLYKNHHCCIYPTKAEGIGLPIVESIACGIPTIASYNSGTQEYLNSDIAFLLKNGTKESIYDSVFFPRKGEFGEWIKPSIEEIIDSMKFVYNNYTKALAIGKNGAEYMKNTFKWKQPAEKLLKLANAL